MGKKLLAINALILCSAFGTLQAQQEFIATNGAVYKLNNDGSLKSIKTKEEAYMSIGDRRDEQSCIKKATLKAKAEIAKFLKEGIKAEETLSSIEKAISDTKAGTSRKVAETLSQNISTQAEALLRGVIVLESKVFRAEKYCEVTVGISEKTMNAAQSTQNALDKSFSGGKMGNETKPRTQEIQSDDSTHRRSPHYNDF